MSDNASIFLTGEISPGFTKEDVIATLARLLKTDERKAASLVAGRETLIKRNATPEDVERYMRAFRKAGAVARSQTAGAATAPAASAPAASMPPAQKVSKPPSPITPVAKPVEPGLSLAPGWTKPGEDEAEQTSNSSEKSEPASAYGAPRQASRVSAPVAPKAEPEEDAYPSVYSETSVFGFGLQGRIGRLRYMAYYMPTMGLIMLTGILAALILPGMKSKPGVGLFALMAILIIVMLWMSVRVMTLRLHDLNRSGKWILVPIFFSTFAVFAGTPGVIIAASVFFWIMTIAMMVWPGSSDDNDYGPAPAPNTDWVYIGAAAFVVFWGLSIVGSMRFDRFAKDGLAKKSANGRDGAAQIDLQMQAFAKQMDAQTPVKLGASFQIDGVEYADKTLRYKGTILGKGLIITDEKKAMLKNVFLKSYCGQDKNLTMFPATRVPTELVFRYQVTAWDYDNFTIKYSAESCS